MTDPKPKPSRKSKIELREPAKPLQPEARPLNPNHPAAEIFNQVREAQARLSNTESHPISESHSTMESHSKTGVDASPLDSHTTSDSHSNVETPRLNLLASLPATGGHTKLPHRYIDHLCSQLKADEQAVYVQLYRLAWGHHKDTCFISNPRLSERSGIPATSMWRAVQGLIAKGLIEKIGSTVGNKKAQGVEYRVFNMESHSKVERHSNMNSHSKVESIKEKTYKDTLKREAASPNFQNCPDCHGTGFHYVDELDRGKGVEKCAHAKLKV